MSTRQCDDQIHWRNLPNFLILIHVLDIDCPTSSLFQGTKHFEIPDVWADTDHAEGLPWACGCFGTLVSNAPSEKLVKIRVCFESWNKVQCLQPTRKVKHGTQKIKGFVKKFLIPLQVLILGLFRPSDIFGSSSWILSPEMVYEMVNNLTPSLFQIDPFWFTQQKKSRQIISETNKKKHGEFLHCSKYPVKLHSTSLTFSPWGPPVIALTLPWRPWQSREVFTKHGNPKEKRPGFFDLKRNDVYNYIYSICMCICKHIYIQKIIHISYMYVSQDLWPEQWHSIPWASGSCSMPPGKRRKSSLRKWWVMFPRSSGKILEEYAAVTPWKKLNEFSVAMMPAWQPVVIMDETWPSKTAR